MQVNFPIYKNNSYAVNNQKQNSRLPFTSNEKGVSDAISELANPALSQIKKIVMYLMFEQVHSLNTIINLEKKLKVGSFTDASKQNSTQCLMEIKNALLKCTEFLAEDDFKPENTVSQPWKEKESTFQCISELLKRNDPYGEKIYMPFEYDPGNSFKANVKVMLGGTLSIIDDAIKQQDNPKYLEELNKAVKGMEMLKILFSTNSIK